MKKSAFLSLLVLTACAEPNGGVQAVSFADSSGTQFLAAQVPVSVELVRTVRDGSNASANGNNNVSVDGTCTVREERYSATLKVPGKLNVPAYSSGAKPIEVFCTYEDQQISKTFQPQNLSRKARQSSNVGLALLCPICGLGSAMAGAAQGPDRQGDIFGFDELKINVE